MQYLLLNTVQLADSTGAKTYAAGTFIDTVDQAYTYNALVASGEALFLPFSFLAAFSSATGLAPIGSTFTSNGAGNGSYQPDATKLAGAINRALGPTGGGAEWTTKITIGDADVVYGRGEKTQVISFKREFETTDATKTDVLIWAPPATEISICRWNATLEGITAPGIVWAADMAGTSKTISTAVSMTGSTPTPQNIDCDPTLSTCTSTIETSGSTVKLTVSGVAATTIKWHVSGQLQLRLV
jgi:hypothetical protein